MLMKSAWMRVTALDSIAALLIKRGKVTGSAAAAAYPDNRSQLNQQHNQRSKKLHTHNHSIFSSLHHNTLQLTVQQQRRHFSASPHARDATSTPSAAAAAAVADGSGGGSGLGVFDTLQGGKGNILKLSVNYRARAHKQMKRLQIAQVQAMHWQPWTSMLPNQSLLSCVYFNARFFKKSFNFFKNNLAIIN